MSPILSKRHLVEDFTDCFDFIGDQLSKSLIQDILSEYEKIWAEDSESIDILYDCESLLALLRDHEKAITFLDQINGEYGSGMRMLRRASHYAGLNDKEGVKKSLYPLFSHPCNEHEKECAFIAFGRLDDKVSTARVWKELLKEKELENQVFHEEIFSNPDSYNCLSHLHIREWNEGVRLLYRFDIRENRDIELYALVSMIHYQVGIVYNSIIDMIQNSGPYEAFTGMTVALAISTGALSWITELRDMVTIDEPKVYQELILNLEGVRKYQTFFTIGERLLTIPTTTFQPNESFLHNLVKETGGDVYQVYTLLNLFTEAGNDTDYEHLLDILLNLDPDIERKAMMRREMDGYLGPQPPFDLE